MPEMQESPQSHKWHPTCWPLPGGTKPQGLPLSPAARPMGAAPAQALATISSSATPRTALTPWLTSARSNAGSGTCTLSTVTPSTTGCPTSTGTVSPPGWSGAGAQQPCPGCGQAGAVSRCCYRAQSQNFKHTVPAPSSTGQGRATRHRPAVLSPSPMCVTAAKHLPHTQPVRFWEWLAEQTGSPSQRGAAVCRERLSEPLGSVPTSAWLCWEKLFLNPIA